MTSSTHAGNLAEAGPLLVSLSQALSATVEAVSGSIVRVEGRRRGAASGIAWSPEGLIVTAHHSVQRDQELRIGLPDGTAIPAELVGRDPTTDLAVLRTVDAELHPPVWVEAEGLRVGHLVLSVGRPGASVQAGLGIVSAREEAWRTPAGGRVDAYLQTDVAIYPGFSGSALVDAAGRVAGMNTSGLLRGVSLALPVATLRQVVPALAEHGRVRRGFLGVGAYPAHLPAPVAEQLGRETGLLVVSVESDSPAEEAGVLVGDLIVALDGEPVQHINDLLTLLSGERIGRSVTLRTVRGGTLQDLTVTLGERI